MQMSLALAPNPADAVERVQPGASAKSLGAFYTDTSVADFLVWWAVRSPEETVLDPSFGGGVFLRSASKRVRALGGDPAGQVCGAEIDRQAHARVSEALRTEFGVPSDRLFLSDFFALTSRDLQTDAVVGNPPFIRYQRFTGAGRVRALASAAREGVRLSELCSSWAPFVVHSAAMLRPGGRLAMVVPFEIGHAAYARPVLAYLARSFGSVTFATFQRKLFPDLSEETLLLLAEEKGAAPRGLFWRDIAHAGELAELSRQPAFDVPATSSLDARSIVSGQERLSSYFLPEEARDLYRRLAQLPETKRLEELADVGIGYVTGANNFFHLGPAQAREWDIPDGFLRPAVRTGRALSGLRFTAEDWQRALPGGGSGYLLAINGQDDLPEGLRRYLNDGERRGIHRAYKCRMRRPWYHVPHVYRPDAFLTYMSGHTPRLVANDAEVVAPNNLHVLQFHPRGPTAGDALAALALTSLTQLSAEVEGHALGGGMLKLEPTEAERLLIATPRGANGEFRDLAADLDRMMRDGHEAAANDLADREVLENGLGLTAEECSLLRCGAAILRERRYPRGAKS